MQCHAPYFVVSDMSKIRKASLWTPSADTYVRASLGALGTGGPCIVPYWPHALQDAVLLALPEWVQASIVVGMHAGLRKRFLKKLDAAAATTGGKTSPAARR